MKFYKCEICGNIITHLANEVGVVSCCGTEVTEINPNVTEAATEKHLPVYEKNGNVLTVKVGEVAHPMLETHYITAIAVETNKGEYVKKLIPGEPAVAEFVINDEEVLGVYEYCNLHGLWKS